MGPSLPSEARTDVLARESVMANVVTPYQRVDFMLTPTALRIAWRESILGVIPVRSACLEVELPDLLQMRMTHVFIPTRLIVAALLGSLPFLADFPRYLNGIMIALGLWFLLLGVVGAVEVYYTGGRSVIPVCLLQRQATQDFISQVWRAAGVTGRSQP